MLRLVYLHKHGSVIRQGKNHASDGRDCQPVDSLISDTRHEITYSELVQRIYAVQTLYFFSQTGYSGAKNRVNQFRD